MKPMSPLSETVKTENGARYERLGCYSKTPETTAFNFPVEYDWSLVP